MRARNRSTRQLSNERRFARHRRTWMLSMATMLLISGCHRTADADASEPPEASVKGDRISLPANSPKIASLNAASATTDTSSAATTLNGRLVWNENTTVRVFSPFAGRVVSVVADAGQRATKGEPLALIAAPDFGQAQADAHRAATDFNAAERALARQRDLVQHGLVAQKDVEAAEADVARARSEQQRAIARLAMYGGDTSTVDQVFPLKAPIGGAVVERNVTPGQEVRPDQMLANAPQLFAPLFVITNPARLWVMLDVPEQDLSLVRVGSAIAIRAQAYPNRLFRGVVTLIAGSLDPSTRTIKVRGEVDNDDNLLKAEMLVTAEVAHASATRVAVPSTAVILDGNHHVVFVEESPGNYQRREVQVGAEHGGTVPVIDGVRVGDRVVTESTLLLEQLYERIAHS